MLNKKTKHVKFKKLPETVKFKLFASFNNVRIDITNENGDVIYWKTAGSVGLSHSKKNTPYAGAQVAEETCRYAVAGGVKEVILEISGTGVGRDAALKIICDNPKLSIYSIKEIISLPHNGTRPKKQRK